jgi:hypothetical protein
MATKANFSTSFKTLKSTDMRRIKKAPPIQGSLFAGKGTTNQNAGKDWYTTHHAQGGMWNDRRTPPGAGTPSYVRQGPKSPAGGAAKGSTF